VLQLPVGKILMGGHRDSVLRCIIFSPQERVRGLASGGKLEHPGIDTGGVFSTFSGQNLTAFRVNAAVAIAAMTEVNF